jgi:hypothetical protein
MELRGEYVMELGAKIQGLFIASLIFLARADAQTATAVVSPEVTLSVNEKGAPSVSQGWPLILQVQVNHPNEYDVNGDVVPIVLSTSSGSWADAVQVAVQDATGATQIWPLVLAYRPSGQQEAISLGAGVEGVLLWTISPVASASLQAGTYQLLATVNTTSSAVIGSFSGTAQSNAATVTIASEPLPLPAVQEEEKFSLLAAYDVIQGNNSQALTDIGTLLSNQPNDIAGLIEQGDLQMLEGQARPALASYNQAFEAFIAVYPSHQEAPALILSRQNQARASLVSQSGIIGTPQMAVTLTDSGVQSPGVLFVDFALANNGTGPAAISNITQFSFATIAGTGQATYDTTLSPAVPIGVDALTPGASTTIRVYLDVPSTVTGITAGLSGITADGVGTLYSFGATQTITLSSTGTQNPLTITAGNAAQQYGQATPPLSNVTFSGFVNGDTQASLSGMLVCSTTATTSSPAGVYPIACSGLSSPNYTITFARGTLTITPDSLTVTANNTSRQYGQSNPPFTVSYSGFVNGDTASDLTGTLSCSTTATGSSPAGTYPISCSGLSSTNYTITYVPGQLTITPPPCASNVTASVAVTRSGFSYSPLSKRYAQTLTLNNTAGSTITGPIYVILDNLTAHAALYNTGGSIACAAPTGSPYVSIAGPIGAGASTNVVLQFTDPTNAAITYTTRFLAGSGQP